MSAPTGPLSLHDGAAAAAKKSDVVGPIDVMSGGVQTMSGDACGFVKSGSGDSTFVCEEM